MKNWPDYDRALIARGYLTLWITPEAIETALTRRLVFHQPLRRAEGFLRSIMRIMDLELGSANHTTLSRRRHGLVLDLRAVAPNGPVHLLIDSSGLSAYGEGEWAAAKHGSKGRRGWCRLHISVDPSGMILVQGLTEATTDDATAAIDLVASIQGTMASVTAGGAYDTTAFYEAAYERGASVVVPPLTTATSSRRLRARASPRERTIGPYEKLDDGHGRGRPATASRPGPRMPFPLQDDHR